MMTFIAFCFSWISEPQQKEEGVNKKIYPNSGAKEEKGSKEPLSTSVLKILGTDGPLSCSSTPQDSGIENRQYRKESTAQKPTGLESKSIASLTDNETPSVDEVCSIFIFFLFLLFCCMSCITLCYNVSALSACLGVTQIFQFLPNCFFLAKKYCAWPAMNGVA